MQIENCFSEKTSADHLYTKYSKLCMLQQMVLTYSGINIFWDSQLLWHSDFIVAHRSMERKLPFIRNHLVMCGILSRSPSTESKGHETSKQIDKRIVLTWTDTETNRYNLIIIIIILIIFPCNKIKIWELIFIAKMFTTTFSL